MARMTARASRVVAVAALATLALVPAATGASSSVEITGFVALFHPSEYTTVYRVAARGKNLSYKWTKVQAGKECGLFTTDSGEAKWRHPHKSQMDPEVPADKWCEDSQQAGGHKGTITVVVSDATSSCTQTWPFGSLSTQEVKEAGGQVPKQAEADQLHVDHPTRAGPPGSRRRPEELAGDDLEEGLGQPHRRVP